MARPLPTIPRDPAHVRSMSGVVTLLAVIVPATVEAQVDVTMSWLFPAETVYLADFDPLGSGRQPDLFQIQIVNGAAGDQEVVLRIAASMQFPDRVSIFEGETDAFTLTGPVLRLTNRDLASRGRDHSMARFEIGDTKALLNRLLQTGRFPSGSYVFEVEVLTPQGVLLAEAEVHHDVTNPSRVELVGPGRPFGEPPPIVSSPSPRFLWSTDAGLATGSGEYRIRIVRVEDAISGEEAIDRFAVWESDAIAGTSAVYPGSAEAIQLVPGATYAWHVVRNVRTSAGLEVLESPIYWFRMASGIAAGGLASGSGSTEPIERQLQQVLQALGLGPEMRGFRPEGQITVDGRPVPRETGVDLLRRILSGDITVSSATAR